MQSSSWNRRTLFRLASATIFVAFLHALSFVVGVQASYGRDAASATRAIALIIAINLGLGTVPFLAKFGLSWLGRGSLRSQIAAAVVGAVLWGFVVGGISGTLMRFPWSAWWLYPVAGFVFYALALVLRREFTAPAR